MKTREHFLNEAEKLINGPRAKEGPRNTRQHDFSAIHNESKALTPSPSVRFQEPGRQLDAEC